MSSVAPRALRQLMLAIMLLASLVPTGSRLLAASGMGEQLVMVCSTNGMRWVPVNQVMTDSGTRPATNDSAVGTDCPMCLVTARDVFLLSGFALQATPARWTLQYILPATLAMVSQLPVTPAYLLPLLRAPPYV